MYPFRNQFLNLNTPQSDPFSSPYQKLMFDSPDEEETNYPMPPTPSTNPYQDALRELLSRKPGPALSAYSKYLESGYPKAEDNKPSKLTRLGAILSGAAAGFRDPAQGADVAHSIISRPYERAVKQYGAEGSRLREAAQLEESIGSRQLPLIKAMQDFERDSNTDKRLDRTESRLESTATDTQATNAIRREKLKQDIENAGMRWEENKVDGNLYLVKPDGTQTLVMKSDLSSGEKVAQDQAKTKFGAKVSLGNSLTLEGVRDSNQKERATTQFDRQNETEGLRQSNRKELRQTSSASSSPSASQSRVANVVAAQALVASYPDKYSDYLTTDDAGNTVISEPPDINSPEYSDWVDVYNALYKGTSQLNPKKVTKSGNEWIK